MIESSRIWRRKNFWDRFLNDEKQEVNLDESNGKRLVSEKLDAGYSEYVMGRRHQQTEIFCKLGLRICNSFADFSGKPSSDNDIQLMVYSIRE